jgi:hypothetical protein
MKLQGAKFNQQKSHKSHFSNIQVLGTILNIKFSLIQPQCLISKRLYSKSSTNDYVRSPPSHRKTQQFFQPKRVLRFQRGGDVFTYPHHLGAARQEVQDQVVQGGVKTSLEGTRGLNAEL